MMTSLCFEYQPARVRDVNGPQHIRTGAQPHSEASVWDLGHHLCEVRFETGCTRGVNVEA